MASEHTDAIHSLDAAGLGNFAAYKTDAEAGRTGDRVACLCRSNLPTTSFSRALRPLPSKPKGRAKTNGKGQHRTGLRDGHRACLHAACACNADC